MAYKFIDINEENLGSFSSIQVIVNGMNLDRSLDGYRTLNVSGRSSFGRDIETLKYSSRKVQGSKSNRSNFDSDGANMFFGSTVQGLVIEVEYLLKAEDNKKFRTLLSKFASLIHDEQARWEFTDDPTFYYIGTISEIGSFKEDTNSIKSTFKIICTDPFKYSRWIYDITSEGRSLVVSDRPAEDIIEFVGMAIKIKEKTNKLVVRNVNLKIIIDYDFKMGDEVLISPSGPISINGRNCMTALDIRSDLENFDIESGDEITFNQDVECRLSYRIRSY